MSPVPIKRSTGEEGDQGSAGSADEQNCPGGHARRRWRAGDAAAPKERPKTAGRARRTAPGTSGSGDDELDAALKDFDGRILAERGAVAARANATAGERDVEGARRCRRRGGQRTKRRRRRRGRRAKGAGQASRSAGGASPGMGDLDIPDVAIRGPSRPPMRPARTSRRTLPTPRTTMSLRASCVKRRWPSRTRCSARSYGTSIGDTKPVDDGRRRGLVKSVEHGNRPPDRAATTAASCRVDDRHRVLASSVA